MSRSKRDGCPSSRGEQEFTLPSHFCSIQAPNRLDAAPCIGEGNLLMLQMLISFRNIQTHPGIASWASVGPVKEAENEPSHFPSLTLLFVLDFTEVFCCSTSNFVFEY